MKLKQIMQVGGALSAMASASVFGISYDSSTFNILPTNAGQALAVDVDFCGAGCQNQFAQESVTSYIWNFVTDTANNTPNGDGTFSLAGTAAAAGGVDTELEHKFQLSNLNAAAGGTSVDWDDLGPAAVVIWEWDVDLAADGRLLQTPGTFVKVVQTIGADQFIACFDFAAGVVDNYSGSAAAVDCTTIDPNSPPSGISFDSTGIVKHITCDIEGECGQFSKSVPVPAFAAATLGLGLVGITYLTSRRRKIA